MKERGLYLAVKIMIEQCPTEKIGSLTIIGIARKFRVKPSYLSRSFNKYSEFKLHRYLDLYIAIRFDIAADRQKKPSVKETLELMNIRNTSHFIKKYRKILGYTPGQYCKKKREWNKEFARKYCQKGLRK
jgi:AraC-like DNA-binding protein